MYNNALLINADCRTTDALTYIEKEFNESIWHPEELHTTKDETDKWLRDLFEGKSIPHNTSFYDLMMNVIC